MVKKKKKKKKPDIPLLQDHEHRRAVFFFLTRLTRLASFSSFGHIKSPDFVAKLGPKSRQLAFSPPACGPV